MRALVVDDSRSVRMILRGYLHELGFETLEAPDGQAAILILQQYTDLKLVLVDWNMPVMDGFTFLQSVRAQPAYAHLKIVMVTTETEAAQVLRALSAGANEYIMKPFSREVLSAKIQMLDLFED